MSLPISPHMINMTINKPILESNEMTKKAQNNMKTEEIAGHSITLESGKWYIASRPMASRRGQTYPITIRDADSNDVLTLDPMSYDDANRFLAEFNNGETSFDGRDW